MRTTSLRAAVLAALVLGLPLAAAQAPTTLQPGGRHDGRLDDHDIRAGEHRSESVRVQATAGVPIRLEVASQVPETHVVAVSAKGELVLMPTAASGDLARPSAVVFTPASSGEHFVTVSGKGHGAFAIAWPAAGAAASAPAARAAQSSPTFDPVWGQYAALVGTRARAGTDGYEISWSWAAPGQELVQEYINPTTKKVAHREVIKPGATPGSLVLTSSALGKKQWLGTVQPDGRVLFIGKGLLKAPYLAGRAQDGAWVLTPVDVEDRRVVAEKPASQYARFVPVDAAGAAAHMAGAPGAAPATAAASNTAPTASAASAASATSTTSAKAPAAATGANAATAATAATGTAIAAAPAAAPAPVAGPDTPEVALLRSVIEGFRTGNVPYERMERAAADRLRGQLAQTGQAWAKVPPVSTIEPNWPMKPYRFLSTHGDQAAEWRMDLTPAGRISTLSYRAVSPEYVTAVRNFGTLAALAGKQFVAHNTRASFALEAGGNVLAMTGSWGTVRLHRNPLGGLDVVLGPGHNSSKAVATLERDGRLSLELSYRGGFTTQAGTRRHRISASPDGSGFHEVQHWRNGGITLVGRSYEWQADRMFVPLNDRNVAEQKRYAAQARAEQARQRAEEQASRDAAFAGFMNGLQQAGEQYQQQQAQTRAFNEELQNMTRVAQERQRLEQESQLRQAEADRREAEQRRIAALAQPATPAPPAPANRGSSTPRGTASPSTRTPAPGAASTPRTASTPRSAGTPMPRPASDRPACRMLPGKTVTQRSIPLSSREAAENHVRGGSRGACPRAYGKGSLGAITCTTESEPILKVDGSGVRKTGTRTMYTCSAPVTCPPVEHCESRPSGASAQ
jgi:hypothetical protein